MLLEHLRKEIAELGRTMVRDGLAHNGQGNISAFDRKKGLIAITPSAVPYGERTPEDICVVEPNGKLVEGNWKPTSENALHLTFYRCRSDVRAVVHTHPPYATVFGIIGADAMPVVLNEAAMGLGGPLPVAPYARPGTQELADVTCAAAGDSVGAIMAHHGLVTVGDDLAAAYISTQSAETTAHTIILARSMGEQVVQIAQDEAQALRKIYLTSYAAQPVDPANPD